VEILDRILGHPWIIVCAMVLVGLIGAFQDPGPYGNFVRFAVRKFGLNRHYFWVFDPVTLQVKE